MSINLVKSYLVSIMNLEIGELKSQRKIKLLGLTMTDKMLDVVSKVAAKLPGTMRMSSWASEELLKSTAESCLVSHISYLLHVYAAEKRVQVILQRCLNRIMRDILNRGPRDTELGKLWNKTKCNYSKTAMK